MRSKSRSTQWLRWSAAPRFPPSSTFDLTQTQVIDKRMVRILSWYDNEWGFSNRMADVADLVGKLG